MKNKLIMNLQLFAEPLTLEQLQEQLLTLQNELQTVKADKENLNTELKKKEEREKELLEHNQKLFLRVTSKQEEKEEETNKDNEELKEFVGEKLYSNLSQKDIDKLNIILEGEDE